VTKKRTGPTPQEEDVDPAKVRELAERVADIQVEPSTPRPTVRNTATTLLEKYLGRKLEPEFDPSDRRLLERVLYEYDKRANDLERQARERRDPRGVMKSLTLNQSGVVANTRAVIGKCTRCGAPGVYHSDVSIQEGWPGCWVPKGDARDHQPVGDVCPNCSAPRALGN
jgi:hypothetical protein